MMERQHVKTINKNFSKKNKRNEHNEKLFIKQKFIKLNHEKHFFKQKLVK